MKLKEFTKRIFSKRFFWIFLLLNAIVWIISALVDYFFGVQLCNILCIPMMHHTENIGFIDVLFMNIPPMLLLHRILILLIFYFLTLSIYLLLLLKKLRISEQNLYQANKAKNKLFGIISHDLRSPFSGLIGLSKVLVDEHKDLNNEELREISTSLLKSSNQLYYFLDDLLLWAKSQMKQINIEKVNLDLYESIEILGRLYEQNLKNKNIAFKSEITPNEIIKTDKNIFDTVMRNLISNAIKFTNNGGIIKITLTHDKSNKTFISVIDNGVGISEDGLSKVFRMDSKYTNPGTNGEQGTGLGLLLCKDLIEKIDGSINITSKIAFGTTVTLSI
jgi:K+-sensing histidine kinase KdpD